MNDVYYDNYMSRLKLKAKRTRTKEHALAVLLGLVALGLYGLCFILGR